MTTKLILLDSLLQEREVKVQQDGSYELLG